MSRRKILIVEDEAVSAMDIEDTLSRSGYEIAGVASNGADAIRIAKESYPDLILMDIRIEGDIDGIDVANHINLYYEIPIIFLTAYSDELTVSRAIKAKSFTFLLKPFNERELLSNIEMAINKNLMYQKSVAVQRITESMYDLMSEYIIITDEAGNIQRINAAAERTMGISTRDVQGKPLWNTLPIQCEYEAPLNTMIEQAKGAGETFVTWPYPVTIRIPGGAELPCSLTVNLVILPNRKIMELIYIFSPKSPTSH